MYFFQIVSFVQVGHQRSSIIRETPYIFSKFNPLNKDTRLCGQQTLVSDGPNQQILIDSQPR